MLADSETVPENMKKIFSNETINDIIDEIIVVNMEELEQTFEDSRKKPKTRKKKETSAPEEAK